MKYIVFILFCIVSTACTVHQPIDGLVEIHGSRNGNQVVRGIGVCVDNSTILTSAHVVRDDTINYELRMNNYEGKYINSTVIERDTETDIAYMKIINDERGIISHECNHPKQYIGKIGLTVGEHVTIPVVRSGSLMTLTGTITSLTGTVLAYDTLGRTQLLSGALMTDISLLPGDSGAPILDREGRVLDVVHVQ